ncbi:NEW3 domain-containing protein [Haloarcula salina]|uniref:NEW3 domain-containing protein n=1 Tax=Haloarcula salina TaxID=1429914 RepID=UPI003C6FD03B
MTVDVGKSTQEANYNASGFLYGLSDDGQDPSDKWLSPLNAGLFVGGGARLDGGAWAKGGEDGYETRWEMVEQQYERVTTLDSDPEYVIRISDLWGADAVTVVDEDDPWPGDGGDWDSWDALLERIVSDVKASDMNPEEIQFEIWNEPNYDLFWNRSTERFRELWRRGVRKLRTLYPQARIVGPNYTHLLPDLRDRFVEWLEMTIESETVPDIINWHDLQEWNDPVEDAEAIREILDEHDLDLPLEINEYLPISQLNAGYNAWDMVRIEKSDVEYASLGVWTACCDSPQLVGLLSSTDDGPTPSGRWWIYERYGSITDQLLATTGSADVDAVAGTSSVSQKGDAVQVILGNRGYTGDVGVALENLDTDSVELSHGNRIEVTVERIPSEDIVESPETVKHYNVTASTAAHTITIPWDDQTNAYAVTLEPPSSPNSAPPGVTLSHETGDEEIEPGTSRDVTVTATNVGQRAINDAEMKVDSPDGWTVTRESSARGTIPPGKTTEASWEITAPADASPGEYEFGVELTYGWKGNETATTTNGWTWAVPLDPVPEGYDTFASTEAEFGSIDGETFVVDANGADTFTGDDEYGTIYPSADRAEQTSTVVAKIESHEEAGAYSKAGVTIRNDITGAGESPGYVAMVAMPNRVEFEWDSDGNGYLDSATNVETSPTYPCWVKLEKDGTSFVGSYSTDGSNWTEIGSATVDTANDTQDAGMVVCSVSESSLNEARFGEFDIS